ncbi:hypothetical protein CDL12_19134 [Handroanthus impetiginosus]|uniref:Uncharacterized protein n=1 Tax=Handroanthus impetiginosus TaxID=429701 RepID=A0A2G9GSM6_9LAMI|nr:hypothetical protein CDL12_19134 [Handroanthus impetiginosus]
MAGVADLCFEEFTKLRSKIKTTNPLILLKSKKRDNAKEEEEESGERKPAESIFSRNRETMSETTVFLLMDRFAPS